MLTQDIIQIARKARRWAMKNRVNKGFPDCLCGMCAIASARLHTLLKNDGIESVLAVNDKHCFVISNGCILDVTATQFGRKPITIIEKESAKDYYWEVLETFDYVGDLARYQKKQRWPRNQVAFVKESN